MRTRLVSIRAENYPRIRELRDKYKTSFHIPTDIIDEIAVLDGKDKIIGYGALELFVEPVVIIDQDLGVKDRAQILKLLFNEARHSAAMRHIKEFFTFVEDEKYAALLRKHFNFENCKGIPLVLHIG
jgi:hypothetical protein